MNTEHKFRGPSPEERKVFSLEKLLIKQLIAWIVVLIMFYSLGEIYPTFVAEDFPANATPQDEQAASGTFTSSDDYKVFMAYTSVILLLPFMFHSVILGVEYLFLLHRHFFLTKDITTIDLADGHTLITSKEYLSRGCFKQFLAAFASCLVLITFVGIIFPVGCVTGLISFPAEAFSCLFPDVATDWNCTPCKERPLLKYNKRSLSFMFCMFLPLAWLIVLPQLILAFILPLLPLLVIYRSQSIDDALVNLVAFQIFSQLDEIIVRALMDRAESLGDSLSSIVRRSPFVPIPVSDYYSVPVSSEKPFPEDNNSATDELIIMHDKSVKTTASL